MLWSRVVRSLPTAVLLCIVGACTSSDDEAVPDVDTVRALPASVQDLADEFDAGRGHRRLLLLMSPT